MYVYSHLAYSLTFSTIDNKSLLCTRFWSLKILKSQDFSRNWSREFTRCQTTC